MKTFKYAFLLLVAFAISIPTQAYDFKFEGICYKINSDGISVTATYEQKSMPSYSSIPLEIDFPSKVTFGSKTYTVTAIGDSAFWGCDAIKAFTLSPTIKSIGNKAFYNCQGITSIYIPPTVREMGSEAFSVCKSLQYVYLNYTSLYMGWGLLKACTALESVTIGPNIERLNGFEFSGCTNLTTVNCLRNKAPSIWDTSFYNLNTKNISVHAPLGCKSSYQAEFKGFHSVFEDLPTPSDKGDLNTDGKVNVSDVAALINIILGIL